MTFTARYKGAYGNAIDPRANYLGLLGGETASTGLILTFTAMSGGSANPDPTGALAALGDEEFDYIGVGFDDAATLDALDAMLNDKTGRWSYVQQRHGHAFAASAETHATLTTLGNSRNGQHVSILGDRDSPTRPWEAAAMLVRQVQAAANTDPAWSFQTPPLLGFLDPRELCITLKHVLKLGNSNKMSTLS